ncbi:MurR/RpiR family transcriptional regulator [Streptococcus massiliensis]|uniref:Phosphosugar-binding transcriptional regulator n=1 Tax=Streptococcus massiliensis TaxID=313439 RepID=A0A380KZM3_9STRE|nr:MurR/RpiR family transcriptional regulator [Streptococcus massiliensis]SUN77095.1 phosphosugar-binding transcriptional regulator [Streptococcus massiliensis]
MTQKEHVQELIEAHISQMTELEQQIASYFLEKTTDKDDLSAQTVTDKLHVSKAALTRFAKKCGFTGYREFVFHYLNQNDSLKVSEHNELTQHVIGDYEKIRERSYQLIDEKQLIRVAQMIEEADRVYFFGKGSSGLVAREMKLRLMRLGVVCEALTERESFAWTTNILDERCLVMAFSLSGQTKSVLDSLTKAHKKGAKTVLFSTQITNHEAIYDEVVPLATVNQLHYGKRISPQIPMLMIVDVLYAHFLNIEREKKEKIFNSYWEGHTFGQEE